jgi:translation initiation factor IF-3
LTDRGKLCYTFFPSHLSNCVRVLRGSWVISSAEYRLNREIRVREVRLIVEGADGKDQNIGVVSIQQALQMAEEKQLDLVEVAPNATPPVCRIMDFGKFQYKQQRREREQRKKQKEIEIKEIQIRPKTDDHHLGFKVRDARRWITDGMKVRVRIRFRGREITHADIGRRQLEMIANELKDVAIVEQAPNMDSGTLLMLLAPTPDKKK